MAASAKTLVIGIGNEQRADDAAGLLVVRQLQQRRIAGVSVIETQNDMIGVIDLWADAEKVFVVDAVSSGAQPGTLLQFDGLSELPVSLRLHCSTHGLGVGKAIELARALNRLPREVKIYGIEGANFNIGGAVSPEVACAIEPAVTAICRALGCAERKA